jgi:hypothetical protein
LYHANPARVAENDGNFSFIRQNESFTGGNHEAARSAAVNRDLNPALLIAMNAYIVALNGNRRRGFLVSIKHPSLLQGGIHFFSHGFRQKVQHKIPAQYQLVQSFGVEAELGQILGPVEAVDGFSPAFGGGAIYRNGMPPTGQ